MKIGKLYQFMKFNWLLFPTKELIDALDDFRIREYALPRHEDGLNLYEALLGSSFIGSKLSCNVLIIETNDIFCVLEKEEKYLKVLTTKGEIGWMILPEEEEWAKDIEQVNQ